MVTCNRWEDLTADRESNPDHRVANSADSTHQRGIRLLQRSDAAVACARSDLGVDALCVLEAPVLDVEQVVGECQNCSGEHLVMTTS